MSKNAFNEEWLSGAVDSLDEPNYEFPMDEIYAAFGESEEPERSFAEFISAFNILLDWLLAGPVRKKSCHLDFLSVSDAHRRALLLSGIAVSMRYTEVRCGVGTNRATDIFLRETI